MEWIISKIGDLRKGGLEFFFLVISSFLYVDLFSVYFLKTKLIDKFSEFTLFEIVVVIISYLCTFYFLKLMRFLITTIIVSRITKYEKIKDYYDLKELLEQSIRENNDIKYKNYLRLKSLQEVRNNIKTLIFVTLVIGIIDVFLAGTTIRLLIDYKILQGFLIICGIIFLIISFQEDEDESSTTWIRKEEFSIQKK